MLKLRNIHKTYVGKTLFAGVDWHIHPGDRIGLCGPNGSGKSTLLSMIAGLIEPDQGTLEFAKEVTVGYLPQDGLHAEGKTVFQEVLESCTEILEIEQELHRLEQELSVQKEADFTRLERYGFLQERYRHKEGYGLRARVEEVLQGLGFSQADLATDCQEFSGGWQMRIALAKLLLQKPNLLLLDEPTNYLDLEARNWLEDYLEAYPHAIIVVSHDRYFLDRIVQCIADIDQRTLQIYPCNYSTYLQRRAERRKQLLEAYERQQQEIAHIERFINKFRAQASKAALVQSRIKMLEKMERIEIPPEAKRIHFHFPQPEPSGRVVMELRGVSKSYGDHVVLRGVNMRIERGEKIALVGVNGAGKSTLMKILAGRTDFQGERIEGYNLFLDYFAQDQTETLLPTNMVLEELGREAPFAMGGELRNILGAFLFQGDEVCKSVQVLSGGERSRLALAKMLLRQSNLLLLDEPTNHLDIYAKDILLEALQQYSGAIVFVSHDRYFLNALAQKVIEVSGGNIHLYLGSYEDYLEKKAQENGEPTTVLPQQKPRLNADQQAKEARLQAREAAKAQERVTRKRQRRLEELEQLITIKEEEISKLETEMSAPGFYDQHEVAARVVSQYQTLQEEIKAHYQEWETLGSTWPAS
jgi:ATP-binding cassette subfamily F protein 3